MAVRPIRPILLKRGRGRAQRDKTFSTKDAAEQWLKENGGDGKVIALTLPGAAKQKWKVC